MDETIEIAKTMKTHWKIENFEIFKICFGGLSKRLERISGHQNGLGAL